MMTVILFMFPLLTNFSSSWLLSSIFFKLMSAKMVGQFIMMLFKFLMMFINWIIVFMSNLKVLFLIVLSSSTMVYSMKSSASLGVKMLYMVLNMLLSTLVI